MSTPDEVSYCTRERVQATLDQANAPRLNAVIDAGCRSGSRKVEGITHRRFYPTKAVRYPDPSRYVDGGILWLNHIDLEVLTLTSLVVDGTTLVEGTDFVLRPAVGPHTSIKLLDSSSASWPTEPGSIVITGEFGASDTTAAAGTLAAAITTTSETSMTVSDSSLVGVGDLVTVDSERVIVTEKGLATTTATLTGTVAADTSVVTIPVSSGALVHAGETITVGAESMYVEYVAGNNLIVKRAQNASVLAAHAAADVVYAPRLCTIRRGTTGTTAATHLTAAALSRNDPPSLVQEVALAKSMDSSEQGKSGYSRTSGVADNRRESGGTGVAAAIAAAVDDLYTTYGRQGRIGAC